MSKRKSLRHVNTFGIDATCRRLLTIRSEHDLRDYFAGNTQAYQILGGGSNVLFCSDYEGDILLNQLKGRSVLSDQDDQVIVRVASGENWHALVEWAVNEDLGGVENLALIPGTVGAAPIQNIGAYGVELKDVLEEVEYLDLESMQIHRLKNAECALGYRDSVFKQALKNRFFMTSVSLRLQRHREPDTRYDALQEQLRQSGITQPGIRAVFDAVVAVRRSKLPDPAILGNAGSFFKNPVISRAQLDALMEKHPGMRYFPAGSAQFKLAAAWLIEQCGLKGMRHGAVGTHDKQPLVIVNHGGASGSEVWAFARFVIESVQSKFGVVLEPEVQII